MTVGCLSPWPVYLETQQLADPLYRCCWNATVTPPENQCSGWYTIDQLPEPTVGLGLFVGIVLLVVLKVMSGK